MIDVQMYLVRGDILNAARELILNAAHPRASFSTVASILNSLQEAKPVKPDEDPGQVPTDSG